MINSLINISDEVIDIISAREANYFSLVPKSINDNLITFYCKESIGFQDSEMMKELRLLLKKDVDFSPIEDQLLINLLAKYYRENSNIKDSNIRLDFVDEIIFQARKLDASDIHLEVYNKRARIRFRLDGYLIEKRLIVLEEYAEIVNQIKIKSKLNISEKRLPQDGRIEYDHFDVRISILPTHYGEAIVMRILGKDTTNLSLSHLGFDATEFDIYKKSISKPNGIILISGPTGSGKTTTLYATLKSLNKVNKKIVTVEDPIEYTLEGVNQVQLREDIGLDFTTALRSFLRQDPDIIMLGEIRDGKTAQMAIRSALTGHLVFSTIHTNSAIGTISRLIDMGVPSYLISETLNISIAQRLVRILCDSCKEKEPLSINDLPSIDSEVYQNAELKYSYKAKGCAKCHFSGYTGRKAIFEILPISNEVSKLIKDSKPINYSIYKKTKTLAQKAFQLLIEGSSSLEEVYPLLIQSNT